MYNTIPAAPQLVEAGDIDYLVADYLSEITMSLLANAKQKSPVSQSLFMYEYAQFIHDCIAKSNECSPPLLIHCDCSNWATVQIL